MNLLPAFTDKLAWLTCFRVSCCFLCFFGCYECWLPCISRAVCHTRHEQQLQELFLQKDFLVCPRNESDLDHTLSWQLMIKRWLKSFWQSVQKKWREGKKGAKNKKAIAKLFALNANAISCDYKKYYLLLIFNINFFLWFQQFTF